MREIKFRAWDGEKMISPDSIDRNGVAHWKENSIPETSKTLMQYTGLKDSKGTEIYEGDILTGGFEIKWCNHGYDDTLAFHPIDKNDNHVNYYYGGWDAEDFEVIGNIHENPELLKESK